MVSSATCRKQLPEDAPRLADNLTQRLSPPGRSALTNQSRLYKTRQTESETKPAACISTLFYITALCTNTLCFTSLISCLYLFLTPNSRSVFLCWGVVKHSFIHCAVDAYCKKIQVSRCYLPYYQLYFLLLVFDMRKASTICKERKESVCVYVCVF